MRALALALAVAAIACAPATAPQRTFTFGSTSSVSATTAGTRYGIAGLIPPHTPGASAADFIAMYHSFIETGGAVGVYTNWTDSAANEGRAPAATTSTATAAKTYAFGPVVVALGVAQDSGGGVRSTVDWSGAQRDRFIAAAATVTREQRPDFLALGVEVNRLATSDPRAFDGFVQGYADAYDAVKRESPATRVFTIFQLELMKGHATRMTGRDDPPQWDLLARFAPKLDLVGYTTYPFLQYPRAQDVPADYYADAAARAPAPVVYTEIGWPSARPVSIPVGYTASPAEQAAFVDRFFELTASTPPRLALWSFPYERGTSDIFDSVALRLSDGTEKPALGAWRRGIARR